MTTQKDKFQAYTAALQDDLCDLRDAIELINSKYFIYRTVKPSNQTETQSRVEHEFQSSIDAALNIARTIKIFQKDL